jgi:NAD(P)-dependent dehydrogenase (short-subunit alcohol dehydrogenase family)
MSFADKTIIVTGATSGIGRATAEAFGREHAIVVLVGRDESALADVIKAVTASGATGAVRRRDHRAKAAVRIVRAALDASGHLDVLVNAAGVIATGTLDKTTDEVWDRMMAINVTRRSA